MHVRKPQEPPTLAAFAEYVEFWCTFEVPKRAGHPKECKQPFALAKGKLVTLSTHTPATFESRNPYVVLKEVCCCFFSELRS